MQVRVHRRPDGSIARIDPPTRIEGSFAGVKLRCWECGYAPRGGVKGKTEFDEGTPSGGLSFWEFTDGDVLLCYMCAARILAFCETAGQLDSGFWLEDVVQT